MSLRRRDMLKFLSYTAAGLATSLRPRKASADRREVIKRDVCILGGGSSGTFTAVRLRDSGKSVVVLERKQRLGGHCETYVDPATGTPLDFGVVVFHDLPVVRDYFACFQVPLVPAALGAGTVENFDYRTGLQVTGYAPPSQAAVGQALFSYYGYLLNLKATYYDLDSGFNLPTPVPPDLLLPFGAFVQKYSLQALVPTVFDFGQGLGNILEAPTVYVMKNFSAQVVRSIFGNSFLAAANGNSEIYQKATQFLGEDVVFGAQLESVERHHEGVDIFVDTPEGRRLIHCQKLVVTCPPILDNFGAFELDALESSTFNRFRWSYYWTGLVTLSGFPADLTVANIGADTLYNLPPLPGLYAVSATRIPGIWDIKYGSPTRLDDGEVRERIVEDIHRLSDPQSFPTPAQVTSFVTFSAHNPFELRVTPDEIAGGFYTTLESLQGHNHTFYNGAAFHTHDSSLLWQFTNDHVLPKILA